MVKVLEKAFEQARNTFIKEVKEYIKANSNYIEINKNVLLHKYVDNSEGEDYYMMLPYFVDCIRVDDDGEVVVDYKDDEDTYVDMLEIFSFDDLYNICSTIKEN